MKEPTMAAHPTAVRPRKQRPKPKRRKQRTPALTPIQERFVQEYMLCMSGTQAAIRAGYAEEGASSVGCNNLKKPAIAAAIAAAKAKRAQESEIDAAYVLQRLKVEAEREGEGSSHAARVSALGLIGKHLGMFVERFDISQKQVHQVVFYLPDNKRDLDETELERGGQVIDGATEN